MVRWSIKTVHALMTKKIYIFLIGRTLTSASKTMFKEFVIDGNDARKEMLRSSGKLKKLKVNASIWLIVHLAKFVFSVILEVANLPEITII